MDQAVEVALRFKDGSTMFDTDDDECYLVRVPGEEGDALVWADRLEIVSPPEPESISISMDLDVLEEVKRMPRVENALEMDFFMVPMQVSAVCLKREKRR